MAIFTFENVTFKYPISGRRKTPPIDGVSFTVRQGEFVLLCGATGSGKSTLMKLMKPQLTPKGTLSGSVKYFGRDFSEFDGERTAFEIGFVSQDPETQIVTDTVRHELAFGLENRGVDSDTIRRKVGETASFFGLESIFNSKTELLSGGQKQLLCLASVMVTEPKVLILDEPTSQLDPIAASEFLSTVFRLNRELGLTVIISEHRTEDIFPNADKIIMLEDGKILCDGSPREVAEKTEAFGNEGIFSSLPTALKIGSKLSQKGKLPLTVKEGRDFLTENYEAATVPPSAEKKRGAEAVTAEDVYFRYEKHGTDILSNMSFTACEGEFLCILGGNGAGKSTAIKVLTGLLKPYSGTVKIRGKNISKTSADVLYRRNIALLPQDPKTVLTEDSVELSLRSVCSALGLSEDETREAMGKISEKMNLSSFMDRHPYDLSGGERQRAALAAVLLSEPKILFLDEPTKGIDSHSKIKLGQIFNELKNEGVTVIAVSHDVEFAAEYCDRCALFFDGGLISSGTVREFFSGNSFYTTAANRMARHLFPGLVTWREVVEECRKQN